MQIVKLCLNYITYDPNYNYEADEGEAAANFMDTEDEEYADSEEYSDDDDMSWKVRRSAAKCLEAVISTRHELVEEFYRTLSPALIARFKEREENVKSDIFHAYIALLKSTRPHDDLTNPDSMDQVPSPIQLLQDQVPNIVTAIQPLMGDKSIKTRQDCFLLLRELLNALPGGLSNNFEQLMPGIQYSLSDKNSSSNMKIDALGFIYCMLQSHSPQVFQPHIPTLVPLVVNSVFDPFYKIATEALLVLQHMVKVIRPLSKLYDFYCFSESGNNNLRFFRAFSDSQVCAEFSPFVGQLYDCTLQKLKSQEVDQEVKERAIACMGQIIANMGDILKAELDVCLPIFLERLRNEVTRLSAVKALTMVAASSLHVDLTPILVSGRTKSEMNAERKLVFPILRFQSDTIPLLGSFLRKNQRALKLNSLSLLDTFVNNYNSCINPQLLKGAIAETPPLLSESDLHVAQLTLVLLTSTAKYQSRQALVGIHTVILPEVMTLVRSPLLQGTALNCTLNLFQALVQAQLPGLGYRELLEMLMFPVSNQQQNIQLHKQAFHSLAKCVAALTLQVQNEAVPLAVELLQDIQRKQRNDSQIVFDLLTIGEIGRHL